MGDSVRRLARTHRFDFTVPVGHVTFTYENADGSTADDKHVFVGKGSDGKGVYHNAGPRYPLPPGTYTVVGWQGDYDRVVFEVRLGEEQIVTLREKG